MKTARFICGFAACLILSRTKLFGVPPMGWPEAIAISILCSLSGFLIVRED